MRTLVVLTMSALIASAVADVLDPDLHKAIESDCTRWVAHARGAKAQECFLVIDLDGVGVANAAVCCTFRTGGGTTGWNDVHGLTDTNGICTINGISKADMEYRVSKNGYYCSRGQVKYMETHSVPAVVDGRWQPYGEKRTVVLKRIKDPYAVKVHADEQCHRKIPVFGQWLSFDMEVSDWLAPYGNGVHNDVLMRFEKAGSGRVGDFAYTMDACFTNNPHAGFYCKPMDEYSDLKTDYCADTNANYCTNYRYVIDAISKGPVRKIGLETDS